MKNIILLVVFGMIAPLPARAQADGGASDSTASAAAGASAAPRVETLVTADSLRRMVDPAGLTIDAFGRLYVSDASLHCLQRFDRDGRWLGASGNLGSEPGELRVPGAVVRLGALGVGVLDRENRRVVAFDLFGRRTGIALDLTDPRLEAQIGRVDPGVLASDRGGALYVTDPLRERILCFDVSGIFLRSVGSFGARPGQLRGLRGLAVTSRGELVVTERHNARVQVLDSSGRPLRSWPLPVERGRADLAVAVDAGGRVAVADDASGRLWVFDAAGKVVAEAESLGHARAITFAPDGRLLIAGRNPVASVRALTLAVGSGTP